MSAAVGALALLYRSLSALTDDVVDHLYHIDTATPQAHPTFLFLVGAPGAGKSSGHARAIESGLLPASGYATLNVDTLLEALAPFRAASSMAHLLKKGDKTRELTTFGSIDAYQTRKENLGLFKWYNTAHDALATADPETIAALNTVRAQFTDLTDRDADAKLLDLNDAAMERAIARRVPIVYETTLSLNKSGRVTKVDDIMRTLPPEYVPVMLHIRADPADLPARVRARQEKQMPADLLPYYRYVPTGALVKMAEATAEAFDHIRTSRAYAKIRERMSTFTDVENPFDAARLEALPAPPPFATQLDRIVKAYGPGSPYAPAAAAAPAPVLISPKAVRPASSSSASSSSSESAKRTRRRPRTAAASPPRTGGASAAAAPVPEEDMRKLASMLERATLGAGTKFDRSASSSSSSSEAAAAPVRARRATTVKKKATRKATVAAAAPNPMELIGALLKRAGPPKKA